MSFLTTSLDTGVESSFGTSNEYKSGLDDKGIIKKFALNAYSSYFTVFEYINEIFTILSTIDISDDTITAYYENEFIKAFPLDRITSLSTMIEKTETEFTSSINSNESAIQPEDIEYISKIYKHMIIAYRQIDFLTLTVSKITILLEIRAENDSLQYYRDTLTNLEKLREYIRQNYTGLQTSLFEVNVEINTNLNFIEPYNTYVKIYNFPEGGVFEAEKIQNIQNYFDLGYSSDTIISFLNV
tara:strand:+ start:962 stop:1687 length:726 start_codon:yes stop_codon:yes gene_type:complete